MRVKKSAAPVADDNDDEDYPLKYTSSYSLDSAYPSVLQELRLRELSASTAAVNGYKNEDENQAINRLSAAERSVSDILIDFCGRTSSHGIPHIDTSRSLTGKLFWTVIFLAYSVAFILHTYYTIIVYLEYSVILRMDLCFKKGDTILITQKTDEGWWEGTLNGKTGWFPTNYVTTEARPKSSEKFSRSKSPSNKNNPDLNVNLKPQPVVTPTGQDSRWIYRKMVLQDLIESERAHVEELETLLNLYLKPLKNENLLSQADFSQLVGNIEQIMQHQLAFLKAVEEHIKKPSKEQRVGNEFMKLAPTLKTLLKIYCENHPLAVEILTKHRELLTSFMTKMNSDMMTLTTGLSRPFRHLDKYPNILQELERNIEENHPDRGDTQRAASVYRELATFCNDVRKQKEMQLELLAGQITGWDGPALSTMGDILYMRSVPVLLDTEKVDCFLVLFTNALFVLHVSHQLNSYIFKKKVELNGVIVKKPSDVSASTTPHTLVLQSANKGSPSKSPTILLTLVLPNIEELNKWIELFLSCEGLTVDDSCTVIHPTSPVSFSTVQNQISPSVKPQVSTMPSPGYAELTKNGCSLASQSMPRLERIQQQQSSTSATLQSPTSPRSLPPRRFSGYSLRPLPPLRSNFALDSAKNVKLRKKDLPVAFDQEDTELLKVVEAYCTNASSKTGVLRKGVDSPQLLVAEEEKIFVEEMIGDEIVVQEKTLVDTVYSLKDKMNEMKEDIKKLTKIIEDEQRARRRMEEILRRLLLSQRNSTPKLQLNGDDRFVGTEENGTSSTTATNNNSKIK